MGFFTADNETSPPSGDLAPLTIDRITQSLERLEWDFHVDDASNGVIAGWEYGSFAFFTSGKSDEILCVRGFWRGVLNEADHAKALEICNDWNVNAIWPKVCVLSDEQDTLRLNTEHNVDYEHGLSNAQLDQHLICAVSASLMYFEKIIETFPEAWAQVALAD